MNSEITLNNKWILWYHDPLDTNWELTSYKKLQDLVFKSSPLLNRFVHRWK